MPAGPITFDLEASGEVGRQTMVGLLCPDYLLLSENCLQEDHILGPSPPTISEACQPGPYFSSLITFPVASAARINGCHFHTGLAEPDSFVTRMARLPAGSISSCDQASCVMPSPFPARPCARPPLTSCAGAARAARAWRHERPAARRTQGAAAGSRGPVMGSCVSRDLFTSAHKDCPMPQGTDLPSSHPPTTAPDHVTGKDKQMDFCWDPWQRCFQTTNGYLSDSRSCSSNYNVAALATSSLVGVVQSIKDHITKPTAMARGRVAHLIEWKGWSAQWSGWELSSAEDERYCCLPDELREARFAAGVAEQFAITEATLSAWSSLDDEELHPENSTQDIVHLQDLESIYLQDSFLSPSQDESLLAFSSSGLSPDGWPSPEEPPSTVACLQPPSPEQQHRQRLPGGLGQSSLPSVNSGSLSEEEDEVFYN
ncbi:PREDICTED: protein FAM131C [Chrysochloris asiatica]|uniref:Protein FAM131C n=1 Tax=Chrysochloris asiatica TaxID=185453 RepID=A0A9B0WSM8_CHRAS|nr:PREDICTED: protein FAM131C [Chrysochloris asiatica]